MGPLRAEGRQGGQQRPRLPGAHNDFIFKLTEFYILLPNAQHTNGLSGVKNGIHPVYTISLLYNVPIVSSQIM